MVDDGGDMNVRKPDFLESFFCICKSISERNCFDKLAKDLVSA